MRYSLQQFQQFRVAIIRDSTLLSKVVVVGRNELSYWHQAGRLVLHQVYDLPTELDQLRVTNWTLGALQPRICTT